MMGFVIGGVAHIRGLLGKGLGLRTAGRNAGVRARCPEAGPGCPRPPQLLST